MSSMLCFTLPVTRPKRLLVIDDDVDMARLCQLYLDRLGFSVSGAHDSETLEAQLAGALPDVVILDILMPRWDGWTILRRLRTSALMAEVPIIVCSVITRPELALALGANKVLQKPVTQETLVTAIQEVLAVEGSPA